MTIFAALLALLGLVLAGLGGWLLVLGGSAYYLPAGLGLIACAILLRRSYRRGAIMFAILYGVSFAWSLWEVGLDGWALLPRLGLLTALGLILILLRPARADRKQGLWTRRAAETGVIVLIVAGVLAFASRSNLTDPGGANAAGASSLAEGSGDWLHFGADVGGSRHAALDQITPANVGQMELAWTYRVGPAPEGKIGDLEATPIKIGDSLYLCSPFNDVIALDAETGKQRWRYHHPLDLTGIVRGLCRGVAYYRQPDAQGHCAERILSGTLDGRLIALDARDGKRCEGFGENGEVNLLTGLGKVIPGYYYVSSAPLVVRGKVVIGGRVADGQYVGEPAGAIRAFDAVTGEFAWAFDPGKPDDHGPPAPGKSYTLGTPNSWAPMSGDETLGMVFAPTGNATPDYFSGHRTPEQNKYASSVIALDAETGALRWSFQTTHRDIWDYDVASQPTLIDLPRNGGIVPALIQPTKRGEVFLLDRRTGEPLATVEERKVPQSDVPGEHTPPTQPFSTGLPSFGGPPLTEASMWGITPFDQALCRIRFRQARYEGPLTPLGLDRPTIVYPGYAGGMNWGGVSVDPERHIMIVNSLHVAMYDQLLTRAEADKRGLAPFRPDGKIKLGAAVAQKGTPYGADITMFFSPFGIPCQQPPYGMLSAVDLDSGRLLWTQRFGNARKSGPFGLKSGLPIPLGAPNIGGSVTTASGLTFIAAASDQYLRAYDSRTGKELWHADLPAGGQAGAMSYISPRSGRQFVAVSAGGSALMQSTRGDYVVAYALPKADPAR